MINEFDELEYENQLNDQLSFQQETYEIMQIISTKWKSLKTKLKHVEMNEAVKGELVEFDNLLNYFL